MFVPGVIMPQVNRNELNDSLWGTILDNTTSIPLTYRGHKYLASNGTTLKVYDNKRDLVADGYKILPLSEITKISKQVLGPNANIINSSRIAASVEKIALAKERNLKWGFQPLMRLILRVVSSVTRLFSKTLADKIVDYQKREYDAPIEEVQAAKEFARIPKYRRLANGPDVDAEYLNKLSQIIDNDVNRSDIVATTIQATIDDQSKIKNHSGSRVYLFEFSTIGRGLIIGVKGQKVSQLRKLRLSSITN
jgi:hypothetical protein